MEPASSSAPLVPAIRDHVPLERPSLARSVATGAARGFAAGLAATVAMSAVMLAAQKAGLLGRMPPQKITDRLLGVFGVRYQTSKTTRKALGTLNHFAFGGGCGALFGVANEVWRARTSTAAGGFRPRRGAPVAAGLAFGTAVWAVSYLGWVPALSIMPAPQHDRPGRPASMVVAHWVFGAVLAKAVG